MVHVGNAPPAFGEVLDLLGRGGRRHPRLPRQARRALRRRARAAAAGRAALERGVRFDVGHGSASFAFDTAERALAAGIRPYTSAPTCTPQHGRAGADLTTPCQTARARHAAAGGHRCATARAGRSPGHAGELGPCGPAPRRPESARGCAGRRTLTDSEGERRRAGPLRSRPSRPSARRPTDTKGRRMTADLDRGGSPRDRGGGTPPNPCARRTAAHWSPAAAADPGTAAAERSSFGRGPAAAVAVHALASSGEYGRRTPGRAGAQLADEVPPGRRAAARG